MTVTYVAVADVQAHLNATYDAVNHVYSVYGINIADSSFQAHVDHANTYINALLGADLSPSDPKYSVAKLAALDLACMHILVVSSGGALVGAFDYFLGDLRVARSGPYAEAIQRTISGFREDLGKQIANLTKAAVGAVASAGEDVPTYRGGLVNP